VNQLHWNVIVTQITSYGQSCLLKYFIVYLFPYCLRKSCWTALILNSRIERVTPPFRLSAYTITGSAKTRSIDSLLQNTGKHHYTAIIEIAMYNGAHYHVIREAWRDVWNRAVTCKEYMVRVHKRSGRINYDKKKWSGLE